MAKPKMLRLSKRQQAVIDHEMRPEPDLHFWFMHALHWHALLAVVAAVVYVGYKGR